jgi:dsDNA-specific endonuclease/ATPase MutS2
MPISKVAVIKKNYAGSIMIFKALTALTLIVAGTWGFFQFQKLTSAQEALAKGETALTTLQASVDDYAQSYKDLASKAAQDNAEIINSIRDVLPVEENYTALTRTLDRYAQDANTATDPFFNSSLSFGVPEIKADKDYAVLPFTMNLTASRNNFDNFLRYIETSGDLDSRVRLMDIKMISLQLPNAAETENLGANQAKGPETLNVSLALNTYYQKPVGAKPTP